MLYGYIVMKCSDQRKQYDIKSSTKSIGVTTLGLALKDGKINLSDQAQKRLSTVGVPPDSNEDTGWLNDITIFHLATQTAGFEKTGGFGKLLFKPGTKWSYSEAGPNWLADILTVSYKKDLKSLMFERVFTPIGIESSDLSWRENIYRPGQINGVPRREFGGGISANVDAMARIGYLYLRNSSWKGDQIIPESFVDRVRKPHSKTTSLSVHIGNEAFPNAPKHYGLLWWNNADGKISNVPRDTYWSWGLNESFIVIIPSLDIVVARTGSAWRTSNTQDPYKVLGALLAAYYCIGSISFTNRA
jgi:CubicO group peptidase (beta-lactamase class C family)